MKIEIYSDIACPWCYIGKKRLDRALTALPRQEDVEIVFRPYQLDPTAPEQARPLSDYLAARFGRRVDGMLASVTQAAEGEGITMRFDKTLSVNTRTAHRLLQWVEQEYGSRVQRAVGERVFDLYFTHGGNVADIEQLADAAATAGVDGERARTFLRSQEGVEELEAAFDSARDLGIQAVPTFVIDGRYAIQGAQPVTTFVSLLEQVRATSEGTHEAGEACADGTCAVPPSA